VAGGFRLVGPPDGVRCMAGLAVASLSVLQFGRPRESAFGRTCLREQTIAVAFLLASVDGVSG